MKLITISLALLALVHHGAAADCIRYDNYLQACADQLVASSVCGNDSLWSPGQWQSYKNWHYSSTPDKACKKLVEKEHPGYEDLTTAEPVSGFPGSYWCYYDYNNDGMITNADRTATRAPV